MALVTTALFLAASPLLRVTVVPAGLLVVAVGVAMLFDWLVNYAKAEGCERSSVTCSSPPDLTAVT